MLKSFVVYFFQVETLEDPIQPVEAILSRCNKEQVMRKYCVGDYSDAVEFLTLFAKRLGKLKKGEENIAVALKRKHVLS